jgi:MFS transporter, DHA2 family, multidrug resistance protein
VVREQRPARRRHEGRQALEQFQQWLDDARAHLAPQVGAPAAGSAALGLLYRTLVRQATLLSFLATFRMLALLALACLPLVLLFRRVRARPTPAVE